VKFLSKCYIGLIFFLLYVPIIVLVVFSFNESGSLAEFSGVSLKWYAELFADEEALSSLLNSLMLAVSSSVIATVIGTFGALGLHRMKNKYLAGAVNTVTNIPMMNPDIVTGISLMLLFVFVGRLVGAEDVLGFGTMLIAHVTFNSPYVILSVLPKLRQTDPHLSEAARDLGCTPLQSFFKVVFPSIASGVFTGMIMAFTLSLDDFVISYFTTGPDFQTLPIKIFSMTKRRVTPDMYALSTLIFLSVLILLILINIAQARSEKKKEAAKL